MRKVLLQKIIALIALQGLEDSSSVFIFQAI